MEETQMSEIIKTKQALMDQYEEVLFRKERILKEGDLYHAEYLRVFGDLKVKVFQQKIICIKKKKQIAYCQALVNKGLSINRLEMDDFIDGVMKEYEENLASLIENVEASKSGGSVSEYEYAKIKKLYRKLAKMIHPDIRPDLWVDEQIKEYWNRIEVAYRYNQLKDLEELHDAVQIYLAKLGSGGEGEYEIPNIMEKIKEMEEEIEELIHSNPYQYKFLLEDPEAKEDHKKELEAEYKNYLEYEKELDEVLKSFMIMEVYS